jgi:hypothetical protein
MIAVSMIGVGQIPSEDALEGIAQIAWQIHKGLEEISDEVHQNGTGISDEPNGKKERFRGMPRSSGRGSAIGSRIDCSRVE